MRPSFRALFATISIAAVAACGGGNAASHLAAPPAFAPKGETKCGVVKSQSRPLVVEWPASDRAALEALAKQGLVPVRYSGCEMEVLTRCRGPGSYGYTGITHKHDRIRIKDEDDLYANVPVHAALFEAKLSQAGELNVEMTIVGRYDADRPAVSADELHGECQSATHVVTAITVGAFEFSAGADADIEGGGHILGAAAGAHSKAVHETLARDGDDPSCQTATGSDTSPPNGCGALIRLEVVPIAPARVAQASAAVICPAGTGWDGAQCSPIIGGLGVVTAPPEPFVPRKVKERPPGKLRLSHYVVGGVALGAIGVSIYSGIRALSDKATVNANCDADRGFCANQAGIDAGSATKSAALISTVALGIGIGGVFALPFIPLDRSQPAKVGIAPMPGGGVGTLQGEF